jgi:Tol biopolymer transport system component
VAAEQFNTATSSDIWLTDVARGVPMRFTFDEGHYAWDPVWSPDGTQVAFSSNRSGQFNLYLKDSNAYLASISVLTNWWGVHFTATVPLS